MSILDFLIGIVVYLVGVVLVAVIAAIVDARDGDRTKDKDKFLLCYGSYFTLLVFIIGITLENIPSLPKKIYDFLYDKLRKE